MGEMMSLVVIHEAIAGDNVDGADLSAADRARATQADAELMTLQPLAHAVGGWTISYPYVVQPLMAAATVGEGKLNLKEAVVQLYQDQIAASLLPGGWIIIEELNLAELKMLDEWLFLDELEQLRRASLPLKEELFDTLLPAAKAYEDEVVKTVPILAAQTVQRLSSLNAVEGAVDPNPPRLPVEQEAFDADGLDHTAGIAHSQIVRATFPWVNYDRAPIIAETAWMRVSQTASSTAEWTNYYVIEKCWQFYAEERSYLYILADSGQDLKGFENWTTNSRQADRRFAVLGFARRPPYRPYGAPALSVQNPAGRVAYAQALVYNANSQRPDAGPPLYQREVGWDTLNWQPPVMESFAYEFPAGENGTPGCPQILLNWQAKLVPVTSRLDDSPGVLPTPFTQVIRQRRAGRGDAANPLRPTMMRVVRRFRPGRPRGTAPAELVLMLPLVLAMVSLILTGMVVGGTRLIGRRTRSGVTPGCNSTGRRLRRRSASPRRQPSTSGGSRASRPMPGWCSASGRGPRRCQAYRRCPRSRQRCNSG